MQGYRSNSPRDKVLQMDDVRCGKPISAGAVVREMRTFGVCFEDDTGHIDVDTTIEGFEIEEHIEYDAAFAYNIVMFALGFGLAVGVISVFILSSIYGSPLDIKSVHKIPPTDLRSKAGSFIQFFVAPLSWTIVYVLGGIASIMFYFSPPCEGQVELWLYWYLLISGGIMLIGGILFFVVTVLVCAPFAFGSPTRCTDGCCACARRNIHKYMLSYGVWLEISWQLQGAMWAYRMGVFEQNELYIVGALSIIGEHLASCGSVAPIVVAFVASHV